MQKWRNLTFLAVAELLAMTLWFSGSAVVPQLTEEWGLTDAQKSWMTMSVQIGFVAGALLSAILNLADRVSTRALFAVCAVCGAACTASIPLLDVGPNTALALRFFTGVFLAGVYPPGMKLMATWCKEDRGLGIGILVGALTIGSATPRLLLALGNPPWREVLVTVSVMAVAGGAIAFLLVREGPYLQKASRFNWRLATEALTYRPTRLANFGYFGHMWELYAMWTWVPTFLIDSYQQAGWSIAAAHLAGFSVIAVGAIGCVTAGLLADRIGRTTITILSLVVSGACALTVGLFFDHPGILTVLCLVWGFAVVADSAQFSAAISELSDARYVGTALTVQTSLGFLLTLLTIQILLPFKDAVGWEYAMMILALGPVFGIWSMYRLRQLPEAVQMASGNR
jgi:MFS family permease